ncbi:hypothetical protein FB45DRAFT_1010957 [Roridomyces roridus]|uniref:Uncharacterized protein n=1 Tax=Roridomyces roridus TaxID=1738132 RepID=A0AAD7B2U2_9AGAR|nr:hypothetical protein FB45DRAFT_1010957 [Roridomyces roridus]
MASQESNDEYRTRSNGYDIPEELWRTAISKTATTKEGNYAPDGVVGARLMSSRHKAHYLAIPGDIVVVVDKKRRKRGSTSPLIYRSSTCPTAPLSTTSEAPRREVRVDGESDGAEDVEEVSMGNEEVVRPPQVWPWEGEERCSQPIPILRKFSTLKSDLQRLLTKGAESILDSDGDNSKVCHGDKVVHGVERRTWRIRQSRARGKEMVVYPPPCMYTITVRNTSAWGESQKRLFVGPPLGANRVKMEADIGRFSRGKAKYGLSTAPSVAILTCGYSELVAIRRVIEKMDMRASHQWNRVVLGCEHRMRNKSPECVLCMRVRNRVIADQITVTATPLALSLRLCCDSCLLLNAVKTFQTRIRLALPWLYLWHYAAELMRATRYPSPDHATQTFPSSLLDRHVLHNTRPRPDQARLGTESCTHTGGALDALIPSVGVTAAHPPGVSPLLYDLSPADPGRGAGGVDEYASVLLLAVSGNRSLSCGLLLRSQRREGTDCVPYIRLHSPPHAILPPPTSGS